ncbi:MAG: glycosyltransferase family 4 protein [Phycisphaerae bacterium]|nr:glycosyltransferase family 4 protein [Phycisphaerae bacterium]
MFSPKQQGRPSKHQAMIRQSGGNQRRKGSDSKPVVLTFIGNYLPGYKAGGILRSLANAVEHLRDDVTFWIVTRDRDLGDIRPYEGIKIDQWQRVGGAMTFYMSAQFSSVRKISNLISGTRHDVLYLNSFFDPLTITALLVRKFRPEKMKPVIVAPRGEFAWASLKLKYPKKFLFILAAKFSGLYKNVIWHASSKYECKDIIKVMKIKVEDIHIALDLPTPSMAEGVFMSPLHSENSQTDLRIVFLSRISPVKNLDFALKILARVKSKVVFDIYGPTENEAYWKECRSLISQMPSNVEVNYCGVMDPVQVLDTMSRYDLLFFPSRGENYGHVIAEALSAGTPVLTSDKTPWRNLEQDHLGWDIALGNADSFTMIIEKLAAMGSDERSKMKSAMRSKVLERLLNPADLEANRGLFLKVL